MKIPNFIGDLRIVDKDGYLTKEWHHTLSQLFDQLQTQMSDESHIAPSQSTSNITNLNVSKYDGGFLYNTDTKKAMVNIDGTFKEITTS